MSNKRRILVGTLLVAVVAAGAGVAGWYALNAGDSDSDSDSADSQQVLPSESAAPLAQADTLPDSDYLGGYSLQDDEYGTMTTVSVTEDARVISTNALPNHETGEFPNEGNPNTISAQDKTWTFPLIPTYTGVAADVREPGVAINGVKFEPGTAERATCSSGEEYNIEALQDVADLGLDFNNAHVQPTGEYHYHAASGLLVEILNGDSDLVHVGFAADGHLIYYSKSGAYQSSYTLGTGERGEDCTFSIPASGGGGTLTFGAEKDGALTQDWEFDEARGDLDECNGTTVDGEYVYIITNEFPYISRCLKGEFTEATQPGPPANGPQP